MREYRTLNPIIPFVTTVRFTNGNPKNNEDIRVGVLDLSDNTEILSQALPEIGITGYYKYMWTPTFTEDKQLFATIYEYNGVGGRKVIGVIDIFINNNDFELNEKVDENDGQAI